MSRPTLSELYMRLRDAETMYPTGSLWLHTGGDVYEVITHGIDEESGEATIGYRKPDESRPLERTCLGQIPQSYLDAIPFFRRASVFSGTVMVGGVPQLRFRPVRRVTSYVS